MLARARPSLVSARTGMSGGAACAGPVPPPGGLGGHGRPDCPLGTASARARRLSGHRPSGTRTRVATSGAHCRRDRSQTSVADRRVTRARSSSNIGDRLHLPTPIRGPRIGAGSPLVLGVRSPALPLDVFPDLARTIDLGPCSRASAKRRRWPPSCSDGVSSGASSAASCPGFGAAENSADPVAGLAWPSTPSASRLCGQLFAAEKTVPAPDRGAAPTRRQFRPTLD